MEFTNLDLSDILGVYFITPEKSKTFATNVIIILILVMILEFTR